MISPVKIWRNQSSITSYRGRHGVVESWTMIRVPLGTYAHLAPYPVVLVKFEDGTRKSLQLVDWKKEDLKIGTRIQVVIRRITESNDEGVIPYGLKAKPCDGK